MSITRLYETEFVSPLPERTIPIYLAFDSPYHATDVCARFSKGRGMRQLLLAALDDLLDMCANYSELRPMICCERPREELKRFALPMLHRSPAALVQHQVAHPMGLVIAADAPTIPPGYFRTALDLLRTHACAVVHGPTVADGWYLRGWGTGHGTIELPVWYRLSEPDGVRYARRDIQRGAMAPHTAKLLTWMRDIEREEESFTALRLLPARSDRRVSLRP